MQVHWLAVITCWCCITNSRSAASFIATCHSNTVQTKKSAHSTCLSTSHSCHDWCNVMLFYRNTYILTLTREITHCALKFFLNPPTADVTTFMLSLQHNNKKSDFLIQFGKWIRQSTQHSDCRWHNYLVWQKQGRQVSAISGLNWYKLHTLLSPKDTECSNKTDKLPRVSTSSTAIEDRPRDAPVTSIRKIAKWNFWATLLGA